MTRQRNLQLLTGTPVNKPLDAYAYIRLCTPGVYRSLAHFENVHVEERDFWKRPIKFCNLDMVKEALALSSISRTKKELHGYDLTPLFPDTSYELEPAHKRLYEKLVDEMLLVFDDGSKIDATSVQKLQHALQQVVVNYDYFSNNLDNRSAAYDLIDLTIEQTECANKAKSKLIIWTKYKRTSRSVLAYCRKLGIKSVAAYSEVDAAASIDSFMDDESTRLLVGQYQSCGAGLNPQHVCSEALFLELDTVPLYVRQALGRLDRVGQKIAPTMRLAVAEGTVQERLLSALLKNDDMVTNIEPTKQGLRDMLLGGRGR